MQRQQDAEREHHELDDEIDAARSLERHILEERSSSRDLPGGDQLAGLGVLGVFQRDAHGCELVADAVGLFEVLRRPRRIAGARSRLVDFALLPNRRTVSCAPLCIDIALQRLLDLGPVAREAEKVERRAKIGSNGRRYAACAAR